MGGRATHHTMSEAGDRTCWTLDTSKPCAIVATVGYMITRAQQEPPVSSVAKDNGCDDDNG